MKEYNLNNIIYQVDGYKVTFGDDEEWTFDTYDDAMYLLKKYYHNTDPVESKEERILREKAINREKKINEILGE